MDNKKEEKFDEPIDIEAYSKEGKSVPPQKTYIIRIDQQKYTVTKECMKGRDILVLAGKNPPERFQLNMRLKGGQVVKVGYDKTVCFTEPGVERFMTIPLDQTEG